VVEKSKQCSMVGKKDKLYQKFSSDEYGWLYIGVR